MTSLSVLRAQLRRLLGVDADDLPNVTDVSDPDNEVIGADQFLNEAYWEILDKFPFREKERTGTFPTTAGEKFYQTPSSFEALKLISIEDLETGQHTPLDRMTQRQYETDHIESTDAHSKPTHYLREKNGIRLWPTPDNVYTLTIKYLIELSDLSGDNATPETPRTWVEIVKYGAAWRGHLHFGNDAKAINAKAVWKSLVDSATPVESKEETDTHLGGVEAVGYDPSADM